MNYPILQSLHFSSCPGNDALTKLFIVDFFENEHVYILEMERFSVSDTISFDHTFKVAANIGYSRKDKVWIIQYDSLFIVMNDKGYILTWQLTKGTSFEEVRTLLEDLQVHGRTQGAQIQNLYVDDCCKLRNKIISVFGPQTKVKLDIFHAVQRMTRITNKQHTLFYKCVSKFRTVFREDGDSGETRVSDTHPPEKIMENLDTFCCEWCY